jgi:hypothetical protein
MACQSVTGEGRAENGFRICNSVLLLYANCDAINRELRFGKFPPTSSSYQCSNGSPSVKQSLAFSYDLLVSSSICNFAREMPMQKCQAFPLSCFDCIRVSAFIIMSQDSALWRQPEARTVRLRRHQQSPSRAQEHVWGEVVISLPPL